MENQNLVEEKPNNKNRTLIIVVVVAVILCCCCVVAAGAGYYFFKTNRSAVTPSSQLEVPSVDVPNSVVSAEEPPVGGLGNDILKNDTWNAIVPAAIGLGCDQPISSDSTIEVLQQPDSNGVWVEKWTVACTSGDIYPFEVEYILDATGATYNIRSLPGN